MRRSWLLVLCGASVDEKFTFVFQSSARPSTPTSPVWRTIRSSWSCCHMPSRSRCGDWASGPATSAALGVASGSGPQQLEEIYASTFHLYPWQSMDPRTGVPVDGRHRWQALSGWGTHSLPEDFQPSSIELLDGRRVVAVVGPRQSRRLGTRVIGVHRMFNALRAEIGSQVRPLGHDGFEQVLIAFDSPRHDYLRGRRPVVTCGVASRDRSIARAECVSRPIDT